MADRNEKKQTKKPKKEKGERQRFKRTRGTIAELKKVTWPTFGTVMKNLGAVLLIMAIFVVILLAFDLILRFGAFEPLVSEPESIFQPLFSFLSKIKIIFSRSL